MVKVEIELCANYTVVNLKPKCIVGKIASLKCHSKRPTCDYYKPSWGYIEDKEENKR